MPPDAPIPASPFGAAPSAEDFYAQSTQAYQQQTPLTEAASEGLREQAAEPVLPPIALPPEGAPAGGVPLASDPKAGSAGWVYAYDGDKPYTLTPDDLVSRRDELGHMVVTAVTPDGERRGVAIRDLDRAVAQGYKVEDGYETATQRFLDKNKGLKGDALAAAHGFSNQLFLGIPDVIARHTDSPYEQAANERLLNEHEFANDAASVAGFAGSLLVGGPLFKGAAAAGSVAERGLARVLASRAGAAGVEGAAKSIGAKIAQSAVRLGVESAVVAAPQAVTEAALGDPKEAAESLAIAVGAGAVMGTFASGAKALVQRVFGDIPGLGFRARDAAAEAARVETEAVGTVSGDIAAFDEKLAASGTKGAAEVAAERGVGTKAVDSAGEAYIDAQKHMTGEEKSAAKRLLRGEIGAAGDRNEALNVSARKLESESATVLKETDGAIADIAFGEGKAREMRELVDPTKWKVASEVVQKAQNIVEEKVAWLEGLSDQGQSSGTVKKLRESFDAFKQKALWSREAGQPDAEIVRDSYMYLDTLNRQVGKASLMGANPMQRNDAQKVAFELYHELRPLLRDEAAWGAAGKAQAVMNDATSFKLEMAGALNRMFTTSIESVGGNKVNKFDPGKLKSYLSGITDASYDDHRTVLRRWIDGTRSQIAAAEEVFPGAKGKANEFDRGRKSLDAFEKELNAAESNARDMAAIEKLHANAKQQMVGGIAGLAIDFFTRPMTVIERAAQARQFAQRAEKAGVLITEQAQKKTGSQLDGIGKTILALGTGTAAERIAARGSVNVGIEGASQLSRQDHFKALSKQLADAQANAAGTSKRSTDITSGLAQTGAPNVARELAAKQKQVLDFLVREMPRGPAPEPFGPKREYLPTERELHEYERKREAAYDPIGTIERNLARGTLTRAHIETVRELYPALLGRVAERVARAAAAPSAPVLSRNQRARLALLFGTPASKPADAGRYQAPYTAGQPPQGQPSGPGLEKLPSPQTDVQRITSGT